MSRLARRVRRQSYCDHVQKHALYHARGALSTTVAEAGVAPARVLGAFSCSSTQALNFGVCHLLIYRDKSGDGGAWQI